MIMCDLPAYEQRKKGSQSSQTRVFQKYDCLVLKWQDWSVLNFLLTSLSYPNELDMEFNSLTVKYSIA